MKPEMPHPLAMLLRIEADGRLLLSRLVDPGESLDELPGGGVLWRIVDPEGVRQGRTAIP